MICSQPWELMCWGRRCFPGAWVQPRGSGRGSGRAGLCSALEKGGRCLDDSSSQPLALATHWALILGQRPFPLPRTNPRVLESQEHWEVGVAIPLVLQIWKQDKGKQVSGQSCSERMRQRLSHPGPVGAGGGGTPRSSWSGCRWCLGGGLLAAIRVTCTGSCRVSSKANDSAWAAEESYFSSALSLADKGSLPAGEHSFPFQFLLPATAPTSFEGPFGKIVHQVRATIDTPRFSKDHQCTRVFYILSPLNLNSIPDIEQPNVASTTKKFSYKLVKTGSVVLTASTDLRGYVVGQVLRLQADIENQSGKDTSPVVASLLQKVSYKAKRWIFDVRTIAEVEGAGVKAWRRAQWQEQVLVPALPQSALPGCSLIHVDYYLQVSLKQPEAVVTLPVFIGNIAVNHAPLSPRPGPGLVVPSAPPQEEAEAVASGPHFFSDPVSLSTKSHSQQQQPHAALGSVPHGAPEPRPQDGSPAPHPLPPPLCISTGATVPYFAEGSGGPVPTSSTLILPPEYSSWGYPYEAPPSYEQSCGGVDPGLTPGS